MLKDIIVELATVSGIKIANPTQRELLLCKINREAKDLYYCHELHNSLREQIFEFGITDQRIVLPWYVEHVRGLREYETQLPFSQVDMRCKYQTGEWDSKRYMKFRIIQEDYPLERDLSNESRIHFKWSSPLDMDLMIIVVGKTINCQRVTEAITCRFGDIDFWSQNNFREIESISKNKVNTVDLTAYDIDDNKIAELPNCMNRTLYMLIQQLEPFQYLGRTRLMQILFKQRFVPFVMDTDQFPCGDIYDNAIIWKTLANIYTTVEGKQELVNTCIQRLNDCLVGIASVNNTGKTMRIDFGRNRFANFWRQSCRNRFTLLRSNYNTYGH